MNPLYITSAVAVGFALIAFGLAYAVVYFFKKYRAESKPKVKLSTEGLEEFFKTITTLDLHERLATLQSIFGKNYNIVLRVENENVIFLGLNKTTDFDDDPQQLRDYTG